MATKYYDDGTYTKGDGKLYYPGLGVVGTDKNGSSGSTNKTTTTTTTTTSNNKGSGISSMYQNKPSTSSSTSILDKMMDNVTSNPLSSSGSSSNVNKTNSGWYVPSGTTNTPVVEEVEEFENPYEAELAELRAYKERQEALIKEQNRLAVEQGVNRLEAQKSGINQNAEDNARQAYIMHMQAKKALPQQLASQGITGGATETANLGLQTTYQNNVNTINQNKANALRDIDNAIVELQNTGDLSTVEQVLANNQAALDAYMNNLDKQVGYNQWAQQFNAQQEAAQQDAAQRQQQAYYDYLEQQNKLIASEKEAERDNIMKLYTSGQINRDYAAALLGIPPEYLYDQMGYLTENNQLNLKDKQTGINNTQSLISNRNSGSSGSGSSGSGSSSSKGNQTYTQVLSAIQAINTTAGEDHSENLAAARYLLNSDLTMPNVISIMKQTNVRPEAFVREMVNEGLSDEDVKAFVEAYTPNQEHRDALYLYAHQ